MSILLCANVTMWTFAHSTGRYQVTTESDVQVSLDGILIDVVSSEWQPKVQRASELFGKQVLRGQCVESGQLLVEFEDGYRAVFLADLQDDQRLFTHVTRPG